MKSYILFIMITTLSFIIMIVSRRLQSNTRQDRTRKQWLELLSTLSFGLGLFSLIGNWSHLAHIHGIVHIPYFNR
jgi:hypothetical protein